MDITFLLKKKSVRGWGICLSLDSLPGSENISLDHATLFKHFKNEDHFSLLPLALSPSSPTLVQEAMKTGFHFFLSFLVARSHCWSSFQSCFSLNLCCCHLLLQGSIEDDALSL